MTRTMHITWRWLTTVAAIAAATFATAATIAAPAHALGAVAPAPYPYTCSTAADQPRFIGWATMSYRGCVDPSYPSTADCRVETAYRWSGSAWQARQIGECGMGPSRVYVYPYAAGWSWIWSQQTGWLAVRSTKVQISAGYDEGCAPCLSTY